MKHFIIQEEHYEEIMEKTVCPALDARRTSLWLEREQGNRLYCARYQADQPRGVVLISHGFTETAEKYPEPVWYFLRMGFHTFCIDHCGHGRSYRMTGDPSLVHVDSFRRYVRDLIYAAETAKKTYPELPLILYGHSMGGGIAAAAAAKRPALFEKVILTSPMIQPETGVIPWAAAETIARLSCLLGKSTHYIAGQKPYNGQERFEESASTSRPRFDFYQKKRRAEPQLQMNAGSYGWLLGAAGLRRYLMKDGWKHLQMPLLIFQAQQESFVSNRAMDRFAEKAGRHQNACLVKMAGAKHEIYNSRDSVLEAYWETIGEFLCK